MQLEYGMIHSKTLADEVQNVSTNGKELAYDHIQWAEEVTFAKGTDSRLNISFSLTKRSLTQKHPSPLSRAYVDGTRKSAKSTSTEN